LKSNLLLPLDDAARLVISAGTTGIIICGDWCPIFIMSVGGVLVLDRGVLKLALTLRVPE